MISQNIDLSPWDTLYMDSVIHKLHINLTVKFEVYYKWKNVMRV
jgi:hypothetical protein